jgi:hypothetical protein
MLRLSAGCYVGKAVWQCVPVAYERSASGDMDAVDPHEVSVLSDIAWAPRLLFHPYNQWTTRIHVCPRCYTSCVIVTTLQPEKHADQDNVHQYRLDCYRYRGLRACLSVRRCVFDDHSVTGAPFFTIIFVSGVRLSPLGTAVTIGLLYQPQMIDDGDCGEIGGMKIGRGNRSTRRKPAPTPLCPPQIPHDRTRARTRAAAVGSQRLTAWAMARPSTSAPCYSLCAHSLLAVCQMALLRNLLLLFTVPFILKTLRPRMYVV